MPKVLQKGRKHFGKRRNTSNFSFSHSVFRRLVLQTCNNQGLFGKGSINAQANMAAGPRLINTDIHFTNRKLPSIHSASVLRSRSQAITFSHRSRKTESDAFKKSGKPVGGHTNTCTPKTNFV